MRVSWPGRMTWLIESKNDHETLVSTSKTIGAGQRTRGALDHSPPWEPAH
jgi:hypothetical protein